jgi:crotonobetainyl-CoA:carnitine CoA-transferase CaiB-like acyl-CoA transferase
LFPSVPFIPFVPYSLACFATENLIKIKNMALALDGMRVLEITQVMSGPFCGLLLADLGADVIKVEKPEGDDSRRMAPPTINGESVAFMAINRNKRGLGLNLKTEEGREVFKTLAAGAEVLIENFRPGTMEGLGLGYDDLSALNPALIYCSISGFGQTGPYRGRGGFDLVAQAMSGLMSITGHPDQPPVKVGVPIADLNAGIYACYAILAAYIHRLKTGEGQRIDTSLLEAGLAYTFWESAIYFATGENPPPMGSAHRLSAPYQALRAADGYLTVGAANQRNWEQLCAVLGRPDLLTDPRFATNADRTGHQRELAEILGAVFATRPVAEWLAELERAGVPAGPVYNLEQVYRDPQVQAREMVVNVEHLTAGMTRAIGIPVKFSATPGRIRRPAPTLGEHTDEILRELGLSPEAILALRERQVVF